MGDAIDVLIDSPTPPKNVADQSRPRRKSLTRWLKHLAWALLALLLAAIVLDRTFPPRLPDERDASILVVSRDGTPLRAFADRKGIWRYPVTLDQVSPLYVTALLNYEDRWFWRHPGVNPLALLRASGQWLRTGHIVSGGSTLTMQVARILETKHDQDTSKRSALAKVIQILRAVQLEVHLSKRDILTLYLNHAPFGGTIEGVEAASWAYLGKPSAQLSQAEAALLTVLPQSPSALRPDRHASQAQRARDKVLKRMADLGVWTRDQVADARIEPVITRKLRPPLLAALLAERLRESDRHHRQRIATTIDANLQRTLEARVTSYFAALPERTSAALLVVDNATLEARAYVGSVKFGDKARLGHVDMVRAWRSPGSTLKPFLYGLALDDGLIDSESLLVDAPQSFGDYRPANFDTSFNGPVGAAEALRLSLNVPAVDLLDRVGPVRFSARLANAGIELKLPRGARPNLSIILGGTGAKLEDLVGAFTAFNRDGIAGRVRYRQDDPRVDRFLLSPGAAWIVREMLEANPRPGSRVDTFDPGNSPRVAWKTGTSYGFRDAWAVGATRRYTVGVWVGRPDGTPLPGQYGAVTALPLFFEVIDSLPRKPTDGIAGPPPASVAKATVCWPLGLASDPQHPELCARKMEAWTLNDGIPPTMPDRYARLWSAGAQPLQLDAKSGKRLSATCSLPHAALTSSIARWPALASPWLSIAERERSAIPALAADCQPDGLDATTELRIEGVTDRASVARAPNSTKPVRLSLRALGTAGRVMWLVNGRLQGDTIGGAPFVRDYPDVGIQEVTALSETGAWTRIGFRVLRY